MGLGREDSSSELEEKSRQTSTGTPPVCEDPPKLKVFVINYIFDHEIKLSEDLIVPKRIFHVYACNFIDLMINWRYYR